MAWAISILQRRRQRQVGSRLCCFGATNNTQILFFSKKKKCNAQFIYFYYFYLKEIKSLRLVTSGSLNGIVHASIALKECRNRVANNFLLSSTRSFLLLVDDWMLYDIYLLEDLLP